MARIPLLGGAYEAQSEIANAQRCINLYPEENQKDAPVPLTHYPTPGLKKLGAPPSGSVVRGLYTATNGQLFMVNGPSLYYVDINYNFTLLGFVDDRVDPVSMTDNGTTLIIVNGFPNLFMVDLATHSFSEPNSGVVIGGPVVSGGVGWTVGDFFGPTDPSPWFTPPLFQVTQLTGESTATVGSGGTNWSVGDHMSPTETDMFLTVPVYQVATLSGSSVATVTVVTPGVLSLSPPLANPVAMTAVAPSLGTGCTLNLTFDILANYTTENGGILNPVRFPTNPVSMTAQLPTIGSNTATVAAGGSSWAVADKMSPTVTTDYVKVPVYQVATESSGVIQTVTVVTPGIIKQGAVVTNPVAMTAISPATGTGASLNLSFDVDATATIDLQFQAVFTGADRVDYLDSFILYNVPGTNTFGSTYSNEIIFDPLYQANKTNFADHLVTLIVNYRQIILLGIYKSEIWINSGDPLFPFQELPGAHIEHGCAAKYSVAAADVSTFWLGNDLQGQGIVYKLEGYSCRRISTHAIENTIRQYERIDDAIGFCYQQNGHLFYFLTFPTADATWVYDDATGLWHQRAWIDANGVLHRHRANCCVNAYGKIIVGDHSNGSLYEMSLSVYTDDGNPIPRIRSFPHMSASAGAASQNIGSWDQGNRVQYQQFIADMEVGTDTGEDDGSTPFNPPVVSLRWSDTRGKSWGNAVEQSIGAGGEYYTQAQWNRLGIARDRVWELSWSCPTKTALNGAYIDAALVGS